MKRGIQSAPSRQRKLALEQLESRVVLDGSVRAFVSGGNLHIQGDSRANDILIEQFASRSFTVSSRDGTTLINGQTDPQTFRGVGRNLDISLGSGNDVVELSATPNDPLWVVNRLNIDTGSGADQILMTEVHALGLHINMGTGNDTLNIGSDGATNGIIVTKEAIVLTGSGHDDARIANSTFKRALVLNMGNNNDQTTLQNVTSRKRSNIIGASGFDTLQRQHLHGKFRFISYEQVSNTVTAPAPLPPVAVNDTASVTRGQGVTINVAKNDTSADSTLNLASIAITQAPASGTAVANADGTVTYTNNGAAPTSDSFQYTIKDTDGNVSNAATVSITVNAAAALAAVNDAASVTEDATPNTATGNVLTNDTGGTGAKSVTLVNGSPANVGTNVPGANGFGTFNISSTGQFTYTLDNTNATINGLNAGETRTDTATYTVTAGGATSTATLTITITGVTDAADVNNAPVRTAGNPAAINVQEDSANTTAVSLGLTGLTYGPGGSGEEAGQTLTFQVTGIPAFINVFKADGTTPVAAGDTLTLAELQGLKYKTLANATGTGNLTWSVKDNGGTTNGGVDTLNETLAVTVNPVNDAPVRTAGNPAAISVSEDSADTTAVTLGLAGLTYGPGGGSDEASQTLTFKLTAIPAFINVFKADGTTPVAVNDTLSSAELQGLKYKTVANANGTGNLTWSVQDSGGTANGGVDTLTETLAVTVTPVNDAPVRTAGNPAAINVDEDSADTTAVTLGLSGLTYGPGGGSDESSQTLTFKVTAIPAFINVFKADGTTPVAANDTLTLAELQGLTYKTVANANGTGDFAWSVQDNGATANGGVDTLNETLAIAVNAINDAPSFTLSGNPPDVTESITETPQTVNGFATNISPGPTDESGQTLTFTSTITGTTGGLTFASPPAIDSSGNLTYTPSASSSGTATVQVVLSDDGSSTPPNVSQSAPQSFTITVTPSGG